MIRGDLPAAVGTQVTLDKKLKVVAGRNRPEADLHPSKGKVGSSNLPWDTIFFNAFGPGRSLSSHAVTAA